VWSFALTSAFDNITHSRCIVNLLQQRAYVEAPMKQKSCVRYYFVTSAVNTTMLER
jgi:hypothetical protein